MVIKYVDNMSGLVMGPDILFCTNKIELADILKEKGVPYVLRISTNDELNASWGHKYILFDNGIMTEHELNDYMNWAYARQTKIGYVLMEDEDICISEVGLQDKKRLYEMYEDSMARKYLEDIPYLNDAGWEEYVERQYDYFDMFSYAMWFVKLKETGEIIGRAGFQNTDKENVISLGYLIDRPYRNKGYGYKAAKLCMEYAKKNLEDMRVEACVDEKNLPSKAILNKLIEHNLMINIQ